MLIHMLIHIYVRRSSVELNERVTCLRQDFDCILAYVGYARVVRLIHVARRVPRLRVKALELAIDCVRHQTLNVRLYGRLVDKYNVLTNSRSARRRALVRLREISNGVQVIPGMTVSWI